MATKKQEPAVSQFTMDLARVIKGLMSEHGVTQKALAAAVGKSQPYVSAKVNGLDAWNAYELDVIARVLGFGSAFDMFEVIRIRVGAYHS